MSKKDLSFMGRTYEIGELVMVYGRGYSRTCDALHKTLAIILSPLKNDLYYKIYVIEEMNYYDIMWGYVNETKMG